MKYKIKINFVFFFLFFNLVFTACTTAKKQSFIQVQKNYNSNYKKFDIQYTREQMDGISSWYGPDFHGKKTANGEIYNQNTYTVAHKILPINTIIKITNLENKRSVIARVNDRGPYKKNRILDCSKVIAKNLGFLEKGTVKVRLDIVKYPKSYNPKYGILPYKQKVIQILAYKDKTNANRNIQKLKKKFHPIPIYLDEPIKGTYHIISGPFKDNKNAELVSSLIKKNGYNNFIRSYRK